MNRMKLATVWLDGCSGCHMSLLDMDERLLELAEKADIVYSPIVDAKIFPPGVDLTLIEGAVSNEEDRDKVVTIRQRTSILVALGDCAITTNISGMRNPFSVASIGNRAYRENVISSLGPPKEGIPSMLPYAQPVHEIVPVDVFIQGCPPSADVIYYALTELLEGRVPRLGGKTRFGA